MRGITRIGVSENILRMIIAKFVPKEIGAMNWTSSKAYNGYTSAMKSETGILLMSNDERPDMGIHCVMSGSCLSANNEMNVSQHDVLSWIMNGGHSVSRIDFAIDAKNSGLTPKRVARDIVAKKHVTKARTAPYINDGIREGSTQYVGSLRNRTKLLRVYDKAADLGLDQDWLRIELELHGLSANKAAKLQHDRENDGSVAASLVKGYFDIPSNRKWQNIINSDAIKIDVPAKEAGNTELWLLNVVAPCLARQLDLDESFMFKFMRQVEEHRNGGD